MLPVSGRDEEDDLRDAVSAWQQGVPRESLASWTNRLGATSANGNPSKWLLLNGCLTAFSLSESLLSASESGSWTRSARS